jgi:YjgF/chorismate_mutase-like putative endoribonuclease
MSRIEDRLSELGLTLPEPLSAPAGATFNFRLVKLHAGLAYIAGHGPFDGVTPLVQGRLGDDLTVEDGYRAARLTALSMLASLKQELDDLDRITEWVRAVGYVHAAPGFSQNAAVVNGFSDLIVELWGDAGRHARSAPGQGPSPLNVPIIIDAIAAVD